MADKLTELSVLLTPAVLNEGLELYDLETVREGGEKILRLYIDKPEGVDLQDCERVSRAAEALLDEHDPIPGAYALEVSSPGIERKLTKPHHFTRYIGHTVRLRLFAPLNNRKNYKGTLTAYKNETITLETEPNITVTFPKEAVAACKLAIFED